MKKKKTGEMKRAGESSDEASDEASESRFWSKAKEKKKKKLAPFFNASHPLGGLQTPLMVPRHAFLAFDQKKRARERGEALQSEGVFFLPTSIKIGRCRQQQKVPSSPSLTPNAPSCKFHSPSFATVSTRSKLCVRCMEGAGRPGEGVASPRALPFLL